jgi:hypothetical protein
MQLKYGLQQEDRKVNSDLTIITENMRNNKLKYNKIFSGYQPRQVAEWQKNQFEDHLCPRPQGAEHGDGPRNNGFFAIQPPDMARSPRRFYFS